MSIARHTLWTTAGVGGQQAIRFFVVIALARLLAPEEFGVIAAAQIVIAFAETFMNFGIGTALVQAKSVDRETERTAMSFVIVTSAAIAGLIALCSAPLASALGIPEVGPALPLLAIGFLMQAASGPVVQLMLREKRFRELALLQVASYGIGYGAVSIGLALAGWSYWAIIAGSLAQAAMGLAIAQFLRPVPPSLRPRWRKLAPIIRFGAGVLTANLLNTLARKGDNWMAGKLLGAGALGFYSRAYSLMDLANEVPGVVFGRVLMPHFSRHAHREGQDGRAARQFYMSHVAAGAMSLPASVATCLLAPDIVRVLLGEGWGPVVPLLQVLGAGIFFRLGYKVSGTVNIAYGGVRQAIFRQGIYAVLVIVGSYFGARAGLEGIAWAVLVALGWQFCALTTLALGSTKGSWRELLVAISPLLAAAAAAGAIGWLALAAMADTVSAFVRLPVAAGAIGLAFAGVMLLFRRRTYIEAVLSLVSGLFGRDRSSLEAGPQA